jgi:hypothetical protein
VLVAAVQAVRTPGHEDMANLLLAACRHLATD